MHDNVAVNEMLCNLSFASTQQRCNNFLSVIVFLGNGGKKLGAKTERYDAGDVKATLTSTPCQNKKRG